MGPRLRRRGREDLRRVLELAENLQWGRVCEDAEGVELIPSRAALRDPFNGAASAKTRKGRCTRAGQVRVERLQWGRVCEDAEGPIWPASRSGLPWRLQWGRVCEDAEGGRIRSGIGVPDALQWGRVCEDAEGCVLSAVP